MPKSKVKIDINHISKLANLDLAVFEKTKFSKQLQDVLNYVEKLSEVNTKDVKPLAHAAGLKNTWRDDGQTIPSLFVNDVFLNAKDRYDDFFKVKAIFDEL